MSSRWRQLIGDAVDAAPKGHANFYSDTSEGNTIIYVIWMIWIPKQWCNDNVSIYDEEKPTDWQEALKMGDRRAFSPGK